LKLPHRGQLEVCAHERKPNQRTEKGITRKRNSITLTQMKCHRPWQSRQMDRRGRRDISQKKGEREGAAPSDLLPRKNRLPGEGGERCEAKKEMGAVHKNSWVGCPVEKDYIPSRERKHWAVRTGWGNSSEINQEGAFFVDDLLLFPTHVGSAR